MSDDEQQQRPDPFALVQPMPFHLVLMTPDMPDGHGHIVKGVGICIDQAHGSFALVAYAESAKRLAQQILQVAEVALAKNALVTPSPGLAVPRGAAG